MSEPLFIVVSGPPASGKSTLAPTLAAEFNLPLIAKDTINYFDLTLAQVVAFVGYCDTSEVHQHHARPYGRRSS